MIWCLISNENVYLCDIKIRRLAIQQWQNPLYLTLLKNGCTFIFQDQFQKQQGKDMLWPFAMNILVTQKGQKVTGVLFLIQI